MGGRGRERARVCVPFDSALSAYGDMAQVGAAARQYILGRMILRERGGSPSGGLGDPTQVARHVTTRDFLRTNLTKSPS
jgi:hypothetical protein